MFLTDSFTDNLSAMSARIFLLSNDRTLNHTIHRELHRDGHSVFTGSTDQDTSDIHNRFDLIFIEANAREISRTIAFIKQRHPTLEVIALIKKEDAGLVAEILKNGAYDFLIVPDELSYRLKPLVERALEKRNILKNRAEPQAQPRSPANIHLAISGILKDSANLTEAASRFLPVMLRRFGWSAGRLWGVDQQSKTLRCLHVARHPGETVDPLLMSEEIPGRVYAGKQMIHELTGGGSSRSSECLAFPVLAGETTLCILEFYHMAIQKPDSALSEELTAICNQIGLFIEREHLELQIRQSAKMNAVGRIAGSIAHDFNNILTTILGQSYLIEKKAEPDSDMHMRILQIKGAAQRAAALIEQLLMFNRNHTMRLERMDINEVINRLEPTIRQLLNDRILFTRDMEEVSDQVLMDRIQLEQVVMNLVVNARDAMPDGGELKIRTSVARISNQEARINGISSGTFIRLDVEDTGCGMDETVQSRIFEPFYTTKKDRGNGIGLATVYGLVTQSGGTIKVTSQVGQGSRFSVYFPVLKVNAQKGEKSPSEWSMALT